MGSPVLEYPVWSKSLRTTQHRKEEREDTQASQQSITSHYFFLNMGKNLK